jgi:steroid 5-alpha reductase family enzyme
VARFPRNNSPIVAALWPACVGALAVLYSSTGDGAWPRRSAIGWMMGSWGARLTVQTLYTGAFTLPRLTSYFRLLVFALFFSAPAFIVSRNPDPSLSPVELAACVLWVIGFAVETTADRQHVRFVAKAETAGLACRSGLWRWLPQAHAACEVLIWTSFALFTSGSPWGWVAFACPLGMLALLADFRPRR